MKILLILSIFFGFSASLNAEDIFRIEIGKDYQNYSDSDLRRRVWQLERAVWQLQQRIFQLESSKQLPSDSWICTIKAMGDNYVGTGGSKAVATANAFEKCKTARSGDSFFCKDPKCEQ